MALHACSFFVAAFQASAYWLLVFIAPDIMSLETQASRMLVGGVAGAQLDDCIRVSNAARALSPDFD